MDFLSVLAEGVAIPDGTRLEGKFTMSGSKWVQIFIKRTGRSYIGSD